MAMQPTDEQIAARDAFVQGRDLALVAGAGTGKTSTLILMGASVPRRSGIYVSFNKEITRSAEGRFGPNVECRTSHSLAFQYVGRQYAERLNQSAHLPARETARRLGIISPLDAGVKNIAPDHQARLVMGMVRRFCYSTAPQVAARNLEPINGLDHEAQAWVSERLLPLARRAWEDICAPEGKLRFEHDHYLKIWAMTNPQLPGDFVMLDEAQDTNPVLEEIFLNQHTQRVCVGDPAQQIYAWRHARDVMTGFPADHLYLTHSFRFGPAVAEQANRWLAHAASDLRLTGAAPRPSKITALERPDAILCRSNAHAMREVLSLLELGIRVELWGGGKPLKRIAEAAQQLRAGRRTGHPVLFLFNDWGEVQEYVEHDKSAGDLKALVQVVDRYGPEVIIETVDRLAPKGTGQVIVSTAHKAKGCEWPSVQIAPGFESPGSDERGRARPIREDEARLAYVAVTRAMVELDLDGVSWLDAYEKDFAAQNAQTLGNGVRLISLPLTGQLKYDAAPVTVFMRENLPHAERVRYDYLERLAGLPYPVQPMDVRNPAWDSLGHVIDYRLRLSLGRGPGLAVHAGVALFGENDPHGAMVEAMPAEDARRAIHAAGAALLAEFARLVAGPGAMAQDEITRLCFVAAQYERIFRDGRMAREGILARADALTTLSGLTSQVPGYVLDDIADQLALAEEPFLSLRALPAEQKVCGPTFAGSGDIGGADADFILGGLLLDCKATIHPRTIGDAEIYQLAGYLLLDYEDRYRIDRVGFYLSRQGGLRTWEAADFLAMLGAKASLPELRAAFKHHLRQAAARETGGRPL